MPEKTTPKPLVSPEHDPRQILGKWANKQSEWVRATVHRVLDSSRALSDEDVEAVYALFRQEIGLDKRTIKKESELTIESSGEAGELGLVVTRLSEVKGVNALVPDSTIEPHEGMTILFGENGTGKTGYTRIFKALARSRTADAIIGDITTDQKVPQAAVIDYNLDGQAETLKWQGEHGVAPFTRMSIFDSSVVNFHVDDELEYVYIPASLSLFNHVASAFKLLENRIKQNISELDGNSATLTARFPPDATAYPVIETLGAETDLTVLERLADREADLDQRISALRQEVAALEAGSLHLQLTESKRVERVQSQAIKISDAIVFLDVQKLNSLYYRMEELRSEYSTLRARLFGETSLPADPEETWDAFVAAGESYRVYLESRELADVNRCIYCRQELLDDAKELLSKYKHYLTDKISLDIDRAKEDVGALTESFLAIVTTEVSAFIAEYKDSEDKPASYDSISEIYSEFTSLSASMRSERPLEKVVYSRVPAVRRLLQEEKKMVDANILSLKTQLEDQGQALKGKRQELAELVAAGELANSWVTISTHVDSAKQAAALKREARQFSALSRSVTKMAKQASDHLVNNNFESLFRNECDLLRAPDLKVDFIGSKGQPRRRKTIGGLSKPSKVLSEGEQKVLALADFLAEVQLAGANAPIVFDDPVSSLDYRRVREVAQRIASLAEHNQVIVFTHDIFFTTTLLSYFEKSKRCRYFHITDENGKGRVTQASGPRWDTIKQLVPV